MRVVLSRTCRDVACCGVSWVYILLKGEDILYAVATVARTRVVKYGDRWMGVVHEGTNILSVSWTFALRFPPFAVSGDFKR